MEYNSIRLKEIFENEFIKTLLKNDVVIYGRFVREVLIKGKSIKEYSEGSDNIITCYSKYILTDVIERDIYKYLCGTINVKQMGTKQNNIITYDINVDGSRIVLDMTYIRAIYGLNIQTFENDLTCIIDIDSLCLRRTGITCLEIFGNVPVPIHTIISNINNKTFCFRSPDLIVNYEDCKYIKSLKEDGYKNLNSRMYGLDETDEPECNICYDTEDKDKEKYRKYGNFRENSRFFGKIPGKHEFS